MVIVSPAPVKYVGLILERAGGLLIACQPVAVYCSLKPKTLLYRIVPTVGLADLPTPRVVELSPAGKTIPSVPPNVVFTFLY
jgi:hypothetical protein